MSKLWANRRLRRERRLVPAGAASRRARVREPRRAGRAATGGLPVASIFACDRPRIAADWAARAPYNAPVNRDERSDDFLVRPVPALGRRVHRVGLSASFGLSETGIEAALERGLQYVFWNPTARKLTAVLSRIPPGRREQLVIATGPSLGFGAGSVRRRVERALRVLRSDYLDVLQLYWLGRMSSARGAVVDEMLRLQEEGKVRALGASIHDRVRAGELARSGPLDLLMIRYNAAHPGAETDIFPHLEERKPAVVAYTATAWRRLLKKPRGWSGEAMSAGDCYRFCLSSPHVDVVLMGARDERELEENLRALERGPLAAEELAALREFGRAVHG